MKDLDKSKQYIVYCASGGRSMAAFAMLKSNGFNVIDAHTLEYLM